MSHLAGEYPGMERWKRIKVRFAQVKREYGKIAIGTYLVIFFAVLGSFAVAIKMGYAVESASGTSGVLLGAWLATKVTQPIRIAATIGLTPLVARVLRKTPVETPSAEDA
jgi:hypothetical protein